MAAQRGRTLSRPPGSVNAVIAELEKKHRKDPSFPLPRCVKFFGDISYVDLFVVPLTDAITTMGIQAIRNNTDQNKQKQL